MQNHLSTHQTGTIKNVRGAALPALVVRLRKMVWLGSIVLLFVKAGFI